MKKEHYALERKFTTLESDVMQKLRELHACEKNVQLHQETIENLEKLRENQRKQIAKHAKTVTNHVILISVYSKMSPCRIINNLY